MMRARRQSFDRWLMALALGDTRELLALTLNSHVAAYFLLTFLAQDDSVRFVLLAGAAVLLLLSVLNEPNRRPHWILPWMAFVVIQGVMSAVVLWQGGLWSFTVLFWFSTTIPMLLVAGYGAGLVAFACSLLLVVLGYAGGDFGLTDGPRLFFAQAPLWYVGAFLAVLCVFLPPLLLVYLARAQLVKRIHQQTEAASAHHDQIQTQRAREQLYIARLSQDMSDQAARLRAICVDMPQPKTATPLLPLVHVDALTSRVQELRDFAQLEAGQLRPRLQMTELSAWLVDWVQAWNRKHLRLPLCLCDLDEAAQASGVLLDRDRVEQILGKLLQHGFALRADSDEPAQLRVSVQRGDVLRLEVFVPAIDISPAQLDRIVSNGSMRDAYTQLMDSQHTLGLAMANALAHLLGGDVYLRSLHGSGASLTLVLPWAQEAQASPESSIADEADEELDAWRYTLDQVRLLLVDDNPVSRMALSMHLHRLSPRISIWRADSAEAAMRVLETSEVDVILMDVFMPVVGGLACAQTLHERWPATCPPIIGLSASASKELLLEAQQSGMLTVIDKASDRSTLQRALLAALKTVQP